MAGTPSVPTCGPTQSGGPRELQGTDSHALAARCPLPGGADPAVPLAAAPPVAATHGRVGPAGPPSRRDGPGNRRLKSPARPDNRRAGDVSRRLGLSTKPWMDPDH